MAYTKEVLIAATLETVWNAWTSKEATEQWLAPGANVDFKVDGAYEFFWDENPEIDSTLGCRLLEIEPRERLVFQWQGKSDFMAMFRDPYGPTKVEVRFDIFSDMTRVRVVQEETRDLPGWNAYDEWMAGAWEYGLEQLKVYCEK